MSKKYYVLERKTNGIYPQVDCLSVFQLQQFSAWNLITDAKPLLSFSLKKRAKLTDVLSSTAGPYTDFLVNEKVKQIIDDSHIMQHQFFKANIEALPKEYKYYWLHLSQPNLITALNYEKSEFSQTEWEFKKDPITIKSYDHYEYLKSKDKEGSLGVSLDRIVMSDKFDRSLDLFFLLPFDFNIYVSESLKEKFEDNKVSGVCFPSSIIL